MRRKSIVEKRTCTTTLIHPIHPASGPRHTRAGCQVRAGAFEASQILAVTFTEKAAGERRLRLQRLGVDGVEARTSHSAALQ